jgi:hypothetical protein
VTGTDHSTPVTLSADVLRRYRRVTLYNSPFAAHDRGCAVDLYPGDPLGPDPVDGDPVDAPSPVAGDVRDVRTVTAPSKPYAADEDHLILVDAGDRVARVLHVDPAVEPGDRVAVGDSLGTLVRAGFFAPWVANHIHLGFRAADADPYRASGSLGLELDPALGVEPLSWGGTGTVVAAGDTYAVLDSPTHPDPGASFAGLAAADDDGTPIGVLDGGLPHYDGGGLLRSGGVSGPLPSVEGAVRVLGSGVGGADGRDVAWEPLTVLANGEPVTGLALALARDDAGVKIVGEDLSLSMGDEVTVGIRPERA